jgi:hypothetical protein
MVSRTDLVLYKALVESDASTNGGRKSYTEVVDAVLENLFPGVSHADRVAGITRYRKAFVANENTSEDALYESLFGLDYDSTAGDFIRIATGSDTDTQADVGSKTWYGTGNLNANVSSGASSITVEFGRSTDLMSSLLAGVKILITNKTDVTDSEVTRTQEFHEVDTISWAGTVATIGLVGTLANAYNTSYLVEGETVYTRIAVCLDLGTVQASVASYLATTTSGVLNDATNPVQPDNVGSISDDITLTFTSATAYSISGSYLGSLGTGVISSSKTVTNPNTSTPYFVIPSGLFGGTWAAGETVEFTVTQSAKAIWFKQVVPAGISSDRNNLFRWFISGQSA